MQNRYIEIYKNALNKYIAQSERTHYTLEGIADKPIYTFGFFSAFRHGRKENPSLLKLREVLSSDNSEDQTIAIAEIKKHFLNKQNKWNNHSFNNYFLDEIKKNVSEEIWRNVWECHDKNPIKYYRGILFRGTGDEPQTVFADGLHEKNTSRSLNDYLRDMNGSIGVSTSKSFEIAKGYALPMIDFRRDWVTMWSESYIYVIDYQGDQGIDISETFQARGHKDSYHTIKLEVNIIEKIDPKHIVGAFYVNRQGKIIWHLNKNYKNDNPNIDITSLLKQTIPQNFYKKITADPVNSISARELLM